MQKRIDIRMEHLPRVLLVHLKRFAFAGGSQNIRNTPDHVNFDLLWEASVGAEYHLKAVIVHDGDENYAGHYRAYCFDPIGVWYCFDDAREPAVVCVSEVLASQAYCLLYCFVTSN